jgi:hypothetical protein
MKRFLNAIKNSFLCGKINQTSWMMTRLNAVKLARQLNFNLGKFGFLLGTIYCSFDE